MPIYRHFAFCYNDADFRASAFDKRLFGRRISFYRHAIDMAATTRISSYLAPLRRYSPFTQHRDMLSISRRFRLHFTMAAAVTAATRI